MATHSVLLRVVYNPENPTPANRYNVTFVGTTDVRRGDTINFTVSLQGDAGFHATYLEVLGWEPSIWTNTSVPTFTGGSINGATFTKQIRLDSVFDIDFLSVYSNANGGVYTDRVISPHIGILPDADLVPDSFSLGPDISGMQPADTFVASLVTISGINAGVSASVSTTGGSAFFTVNNGSGVTSATVFNGQRIQVYGTASSSYNSSITVTLTIGGVSDSFVVTTTGTPPAEALIQFVSNPITLNNIKAFFGGTLLPPNAPPNNLRSYYRGGAYVPDISQNSAVPFSPNQIGLSNFNISFTTLYFTKLPRSISKNQNTSGGTTSLNQVWSVGSSGDDKFDVGYGPGMKGACQFSYSIVEDEGSGKSTGVTLIVEVGQAGTPRQGNTYVVVQSPNVAGNSEARYSGTLTITATYGGISRSVTCKYFFNFFGP